MTGAVLSSNTWQASPKSTENFLHLYWPWTYCFYRGVEKPIEEVYLVTLDSLLQHGEMSEWGTDIKKDLIRSWGMMEGEFKSLAWNLMQLRPMTSYMRPAWKDTVPGLEALRSKYAIAVLSNGSSRTIIDSVSITIFRTSFVSG